MLTPPVYTPTMNRTEVQLWYNRFKAGRKDVNGDLCPSRPTISSNDENIETVKKIILDNHRITIREFTDNNGVTFGSYKAIFTDVLYMKHAAAKVVSK